jgi:hypothetical protein
MAWKSLMIAILLALALSACGKNDSDKCREKTGDGICADEPHNDALDTNVLDSPASNGLG